MSERDVTHGDQEKGEEFLKQLSNLITPSNMSRLHSMVTQNPPYQHAYSSPPLPYHNNGIPQFAPARYSQAHAPQPPSSCTGVQTVASTSNPEAQATISRLQEEVKALRKENAKLQKMQADTASNGSMMLDEMQFSICMQNEMRKRDTQYHQDRETITRIEEILVKVRGMRKADTKNRWVCHKT